MNNFFLALLFLSVPYTIICSFSLETIADWTSLEFDWISSVQKRHFLESGNYIPENCALTGIKAYKNDIYVTVPRWLRGVPSTMNKLKKEAEKYILSPFPNWELQNLDNPNGFKYIL